ncbi:Mariner Mos1 transposase [Folsomia candida]|uniref:Mariner Mos1 transposase n=1 Tax=Folsomia candida TaxID=158441 RepID=A0A226DE09_FOLCA|nr:Mariner Mos1 transposase [Folsomia candida]
MKTAQHKTQIQLERLRKLEEQIMRDLRLKLSYLEDEMGVPKPAICSMLTEVFDDNAPPHTWLFARVSADENRFTCTNHTPCSPDLTLSDYYSFRNLKKNIRGKRFSDDNEIKSYLDIPSTTIPLVLEKYPSQKYLRSLKRRQNDNFRWRCVFHGFLYPPMPNGWAPHSLFRYHAFYTEFWTGPVKVKKERFSNLIRHQDYYVYFMNRKSSRNWLQFAQGVQETQGQGGQSHSAVVFMSQNHKHPEWHISCNTCEKAKFTFYPSPAGITLIEGFLKLAATIHPDRIFQICDLYSQMAILNIQKTSFPNFLTISTHSNIDIATFSAIYPNNSYIFEVTTFMTSKNLKEPRRTTIQINTATHIPIVRMAAESPRFLTCDGLLNEAGSGRSFYHFVSAYQFWPWFSLVILILVTASILRIIFKLTKINCNEILLFLALLVEQGIDITPSKRKTWSSIFIFVPWLLMGIVISNAYKGQNVTDLTSPLTPSMVSQFEEILTRNYTLYVPSLKDYDLISKTFIERKETIRVASRLHISIMEYQKEKPSRDTLKFLRKLKSKIFVIRDRPNMTLMDAISSCNKSAIIRMAVK